MKFIKFLKLLNKKINKYDNFTHTNPFTIPRYQYTVVWVENNINTGLFPLDDTK